jgi:hypothetical protein
MRTGARAPAATATAHSTGGRSKPVVDIATLGGSTIFKIPFKDALVDI